MSHRYDDDPMAFVPYRPRTITLSLASFATLCVLSVIGILAVLVVCLVS